MKPLLLLLRDGRELLAIHHLREAALRVVERSLQEMPGKVRMCCTTCV